MAKSKYGRMTTNLKRNGVYYAKDQKVLLDDLDEETLKFVNVLPVDDEEATPPTTPPKASQAKAPKPPKETKAPEKAEETAPPA